jgi:hypothetical protein
LDNSSGNDLDARPSQVAICHVHCRCRASFAVHRRTGREDTLFQLDHTILDGEDGGGSFVFSDGRICNPSCASGAGLNGKTGAFVDPEPVNPE